MKKKTRCWNCGSDEIMVRSQRTGILYCADCGQAMEGKGVVVNLSVWDTETAEYLKRDEDISSSEL